MFHAGRDAGAYQNRGGSASRPYTLPYDLHHSGRHHWLVRLHCDRTFEKRYKFNDSLSEI